MSSNKGIVLSLLGVIAVIMTYNVWLIKSIVVGNIDWDVPAKTDQAQESNP